MTVPQFTAPVLPAVLTSLRNWLVWRLVYIEGQPKPRKIPYYTNGAPRPGTQGTEEDRAQLVTFDEAAACVAGSNGHYTGVGFAPQADAGVVALDFDDCVVDGTVAAHVEAMCEGTYTELSPSGHGVRAFFLGSLLSRKDVPPHMRGPWPIEVFGHNGFVTVTGNVTPTCAMFGWNEGVSPLTPAVLTMYRERGWDASQVAGEIADNLLMALVPTLGLDGAKIASLLADLPNDLDYESWVKVGMAVHHETAGAGFDLWHNWSQASPKYTTEKYCRDRWDSFGRYSSGAHITMAWVIKQANEAQAHRKYQVAGELKQRIAEASDEFLLREKVCPLIAKDERIGDMEREGLAQVLFDRFKGLGTKYPIAQCRKLLAPKRTAKTDTKNDRPDWLAGWVYVTDRDNFYRLDSDEWLSRQSFNAKYDRYQPKNELGVVTKHASEDALDEYQIDTATRGVYLPWAGATFDLHGVACVNTYRPSSVPDAVGQVSPEGQAAIDLVLRHLHMLAGGRREVMEVLLSWMAHNVQRPGVKIRWAPLIKGVEGDGKTLLGSVMAAVLGAPNVKQISPKVLGTDFTDWAHGGCVGVLEEIKLTGHNRHDILNALKPFITNDSIAVHPKGAAEYDVINTMNYLAFTNHTDALPLGDTDRRWFIVFTPFATTADLHDAIGALGVGGTGAYFDALYGAVMSQRGDLRRWLLNYPIAASFKPNSAAPLTEEKMLMVSMSVSQEEELVREVIAEGAEGVTGSVLSSACLVDAAMLSDSSVSLHTTSINKLLGKLGWVKVPQRIKWKGRAHRVWIKGKVPSGTEVLRLTLDATVQKTADNTESSESVEDLFN